MIGKFISVLEGKIYYNNFQEHNFLRDSKIPQRSVEKGENVESRKNYVLAKTNFSNRAKSALSTTLSSAH